MSQVLTPTSGICINWKNYPGRALSLISFSVEICKEQESKASGRKFENENSHRNILQKKNRKDKQKDEERLIEVRFHN